jgi:hypothetical protein
MKCKKAMATVPAALAIGTFLAAFVRSSRADSPTHNATVDKAVAAENLKAIAMKCSDPDILLGLDFLVEQGNPVRQEIAAMIVKIKPEYAPIVSIISVRMDGVNEKTVAEIIKSDPENACGYYLQGKLLFQDGKSMEALEACRQGAARAQLRFYEDVTARSLFKALDALELKGRDRLCALSWIAVRCMNGDIEDWQPVVHALGDLARTADVETRKEICDVLLMLAGHLYTTTLENREFADYALLTSFRYKAEIAAAENSPTMTGYAAVTQALLSVQTAVNHPGFLGINDLRREEGIRLPASVEFAFCFCDPDQRKDSWGWKFVVPESDKPALEKAQENAVRAASALIDVAAAAPDEIVGGYLEGLRPARKNATSPWLYRYTYAEGMLTQRPDVVKALAAYEQAYQALNDAGKSDLRVRDMQRMLEIGWGIIGYSQDHNQTFPDNLNALYEKKYLEPKVEFKSLLSGRTYVYVAAGEKIPEKAPGQLFSQFILLYDDERSRSGYYCVFSDGHVANLPVDQVRDQLRKQGKQGP